MIGNLDGVGVGVEVVVCIIGVVDVFDCEWFVLDFFYLMGVFLGDCVVELGVEEFDNFYFIGIYVGLVGCCDFG